MGDGNSIDAWNDPWLKKQPQFKATPLDQNTPKPLPVSKLINADSKSWDVTTVRDIFTVSDTSLITSIHLSKQSIPDKLIWRETILGTYTVKSGYYMAR